MKMYYVTHARVPGVKAHCSQIAQMSRSFLNTGIDLELIIPKRANLPDYRNKTIEKWYGFDRKIPVEKLFCIDLLGRMPSDIPMIFKNFAFKLMYQTFNWSLKRFLSNQEASFLFYSRDIHVFSSLIKPFPSVKKVIELHMVEERAGSTRDIEDRVFKECDGIVVVTTPMKELLLERGIHEDKILVEPNGVDMAVFPGSADKDRSRLDLGLPVADRIVMFMGNFHALGESRGLETIVKAAPAILKKYKDALFLFVGGPIDYAKPYIRMFEELNVDKSRYRFLGRQPYDQIHRWLAAADVLVHPLPSNPIYDNITSPLKVLEYMTSNRPMIVSDLPSLREVLNDDKNVLFVQPSNAGEFSAAVIKLFDNPVLASRLARQARIDVDKRTWDARAERISNWINSLN